jgi:hypothetical protein
VLTHYTRTVAAVANILRHGFAWIPNRRRLAHILIPQHDYTRREPQQFGMISFTEILRDDARSHRDAFGPFGVAVTEAWAQSHCAQRVFYVDESGPVVEALRRLFALGYADIKRSIRYPDDAGWLMAYENKAAAGGINGSSLWANLLQLWEFLEPSSNSAHCEWRIVNPHPHYGFSEDKQQAIAQVSPPKNWAKITHVVKIECADVVELVCPQSAVTTLRAELPEEYSDITVAEVAG